MGIMTFSIKVKLLCRVVIRSRVLSCRVVKFLSSSMELRPLQNVNNCLNTNIYSYLETSGGQSSYLYLNVVHFFNTSVSTSVAALDSCFSCIGV